MNSEIRNLMSRLHNKWKQWYSPPESQDRLGILNHPKILLRGIDMVEKTLREMEEDLQTRILRNEPTNMKRAQYSRLQMQQNHTMELLMDLLTRIHPANLRTGRVRLPARTLQQQQTLTHYVSKKRYIRVLNGTMSLTEKSFWWFINKYNQLDPLQAIILESIMEISPHEWLSNAMSISGFKRSTRELFLELDEEDELVRIPSIDFVEFMKGRNLLAKPRFHLNKAIMGNSQVMHNPQQYHDDLHPRM